MNDPKDSRFKSYLEESFLELENITLNDAQRTKLLDGEQLVCEAQKVLLYPPLSDRKKSILGVLTITTFKLSFATATEEDPESNDCYQHNTLLGPNEICLSSIDTIYQIGDRTKKKLHGQISGKVKELLIVCKTMRTFHFSFKHSEKDTGNKVALALLRHAYPQRHSLLFAYDYKEPYYKPIIKEVHLFRSTDDWKREMARTRCKHWRLSHVNQNFIMSPSLPQSIIVPESVTDDQLSKAAEHFRNRFSPVWVWNSPQDAALVRMSEILPTITDRTQENALLESIRKSHKYKRQPFIMELSKDCPTPKEIHTSFVKLRDLCTPDSIRLFKAQDFKFYGLLDSTKWLLYVSNCLTKAAEAAQKLSDTNSVSVVLQEGTGQDMNCIVSSLIQIMLDPYWRTIHGLQSLIQKEWVVLGHHFAYRLGHILSSDVEPSPLFLLFLDCLWQLLQQYPTAFQFSETYLTTLWDSAHISIFETFIFNSEHDRIKAGKRENPLIMRSVWDWSEQFSEKDRAFFCNPLFDDSFKQRLMPNTKVAFLDIWSQCYFRWLPDLEIRNGGRPQIDLCNRFIVLEINKLFQKINSGEVNGALKTKEENVEMLKKINSFFPFSHTSGQIQVLPINSDLISGDVIDSQSILNLNND